MKKAETIKELYKRRNEWLPDNLHNDIGRFNVFRIEPFKGNNIKPVPYLEEIILK